MNDFDPVKDAANREKHGIWLVRWRDLDIRYLGDDDKHSSDERRYIAFGLIEGKPHCLAFTYRRGKIRPISLRRAHEKEYRRYVEK